MLRIKMCGMTRREDVLEAVRLGVDAVGVVFHEPSPRYVTPEAAQALLADLPPFVLRVGVFVDANIANVMKHVNTAGLTALQLLGGPSREELLAAGWNAQVIRVLHADEQLKNKLWAHADETVLIDAGSQDRPGGTGQRWDWRLMDDVPRPRYLMLAGGLNPENVRDAILRVRPDAVDVASGVESGPGIKDPIRMASFVAACAPYRTLPTEPR